MPLYLALPEPYQEVIREVLAGRGGTLSISAYAGFAYYLYTQWQSWRATVKPQVVTPDKKRRVLTDAEALAINNAETGLNQTHVPTGHP